MANMISYGFLGQEQLFAERMVSVGVDTVNTWVEESIRMYQQELDAVLSTLVQRTTRAKFRYTLPTGGTLQPLDEWGNPLPRLPGGSYDVGLPIQGGGDAWGTNRKTRAKLTVGEAERNTAMVQGADIDWLMRHILAALFTNTSWTYNDKDDDIGELTINPLANDDSIVYLRRNGTMATDDHYFAQANAIDDGADNPFPIIKRALVEHPNNSGDIVAFIPTALSDDVQALGTFIPAPDPNIRRGIGEDEFVGTELLAFGNEFIGYVDGVKVVEWDRLPDEHILAMSTGADSVVAMREEPEPELQGLFPEFHNVDGNRYVNRFIRYAGFGVLNRVGAVVYQVGNATYEIPDGFEAPLAV